MHLKITKIVKLPIPSIDFKNLEEKKRNDAIVRHVENLLKLHEDKSRETLATRLTAINDRIAHAEDAINSLVYELYGITDEERRAIEHQ